MIDFAQLIDKVVPSALMPKTGSNQRKFPLIIHLMGAAVTCALLIPPVMAWRARTVHSRAPRIHIFHDMDHQQKYKSQSSNALFVDGRAMRKPIENTVARGEVFRDAHFFEGKVGGAWANGLPSNVVRGGVSKTLVVDDAFLNRGAERYNIFCAPCHGADGQGSGPVHVKASGSDLAIGTEWTQPTNLHVLPTPDDTAPPPVNQPLGQLFNTITNGIRNMPAYGAQIPVEDRWAIVAYVKLLQKSQNPNR